MGSRLHGNDRRPRVPTVIPINPELHISVIPAQEDPCTTVIPATAGIQGRRGWVPVSTGTTGDRASLPSFPPNQNFAFPSFPRRKTPAQPSFPRRRESRGGEDGFPSPRERRAAARPYRHSRQTRTSHFRHSRAGRPCVSVIPATAGIQGWGGWVPVSTGTTGGGAPRLRRKSTYTPRVYRIGVTRTGRRRASRRRSRSGAAPPCPRASRARRRRRIARASAPSCRSASDSHPS